MGPEGAKSFPGRRLVPIAAAPGSVVVVRLPDGTEVVKRVIRQEPAPGAPVKKGQKCVLTLGWMG